MHLSVRDVDERTFKKLKAWAAEEGMPVGKALTIAIDQFIGWRNPKIKPTDIKPINLGKRARNLSEEIDKVLYGDQISILIDSSILVSAYSETDKNHKTGRKILNWIESGKFGEWFVSDYVFDETLTVMFSISKSKKKVAKLGKDLMVGFTLLGTPQAIFLDAFDIFSQDNKLSFTDSALISMANKYNIEFIATFDKEIKKHFKFCIDGTIDLTDIKKSRGIAKGIITENLRDESDRFD